MSISAPSIASQPQTAARQSSFGGRLLEQLEKRMGITSNGAILVALSAVGWILASRIGGRSMFLIVYAALVVLLLSWVVGRRTLSVEALRSDLPARVREGQVVNVELKLTAKRRLSAVILEETLHPFLGTSVRVPIPTLPGGEEVQHVYTFSPRLRGVYKVGPLEATWSDPFGLTRRRVLLTEATEIIVHPSTELVHDRVLTREWEDPPIRPPISKPWPTGFEFYGMRDYVSGDDPRRIIWRATARTLDPVSGLGKILVRESEQGITDRVSLVLDTDSRWHSPGNPSETFEVAVRTIASLGARHLRDGFGVTLESNGRRIADGFRGRRMNIRLLDELARLQPEKLPLTKAFERMMSDPRRDLHNVVVTPHIDNEAAKRLRLLIDRGTSMMVAVIVWEETDPDALHRAASLGCNIVEIRPKVPLETAFRKVVGTGISRQL